MASDPLMSGQESTGATAVITHRVRDAHHAGYESWLGEIGPLCRSATGLLDWQIVRPVPGVTGTYTVIIRFDSEENLRAWMDSDERRRLIEKVRPMLATDDDFHISSGLDFWFTPRGASAQLPVRWRQALVTWSAIYPLVLIVPLVVAPVLRLLGLAPNRYLDTLIFTGVTVLLMVYVVMPHYTRLIRRWLFR